MSAIGTKTLMAYRNGVNERGAWIEFEDYRLGPGTMATQQFCGSNLWNPMCDIVIDFGESIVGVDYGDGILVDVIEDNGETCRVMTTIEDSDIFQFVFTVESRFLN